MMVGDLLVPQELEAELIAGRRALSKDEVASLTPLLRHLEKPMPEMYDIAGIVNANKLWWLDADKFYVGAIHQLYRPGNIDPTRSLIIGFAEPDSPIALDYRTDPPASFIWGMRKRRATGSFWRIATAI
jgi:hypothetical protein